MANFDDVAKVDLDFMNNEHHAASEMMRVIKRDYNNNDVDAVIKGLLILQEHSIEHFLHEEQAMRAHFYPPYKVHKQEHDRALMELDIIIKQLINHKDLAKVKGYVLHAMSNWFLQHMATMDRMAAQFIITEKRASA